MRKILHDVAAPWNTIDQLHWIGKPIKLCVAVVDLAGYCSKCHLRGTGEAVSVWGEFCFKKKRKLLLILSQTHNSPHTGKIKVFCRKWGWWGLTSSDYFYCENLILRTLLLLSTSSFLHPSYWRITMKIKLFSYFKEKNFLTFWERLLKS